MSLAQACAMLPEHAWTEVLKHSSDAGLATLLAVGDKTIASAWQAVQHEWAAQHKPSTLVDHWAASGNTQALRGMLAAGQWHASWLNQALVKACERGHSDCVHALITAGADQLDFALAVAAGKGHLQAVQRLLEAGASHSRHRAMEAAVYNRHQAVVDALLAAGAELPADSEDEEEAVDDYDY